MTSALSVVTSKMDVRIASEAMVHMDGGRLRSQCRHLLVSVVDDGICRFHFVYG